MNKCTQHCVKFNWFFFHGQYFLPNLKYRIFITLKMIDISVADHCNSLERFKFSNHKFSNKIIIVVSFKPFILLSFWDKIRKHKYWKMQNYSFMLFKSKQNVMPKLGPFVFLHIRVTYTQPEYIILIFIFQDQDHTRIHILIKNTDYFTDKKKTE